VETIRFLVNIARQRFLSEMGGLVILQKCFDLSLAINSLLQILPAVVVCSIVLDHHAA
jgi:uncharacterized membrane protein